METFWYGAVAVMVAGYVVLDGFDLGAGALHLFVAREDRERREVLAAIGPVWDGNEVWLLAGGGTLFFAFPRAYAAGFSGFYLPLMLVLWLLILRGLAIEMRSHLEAPVWRAFFDGTLAFSSTLLCVVLGAALGNVLRGVPLDATGSFLVPLFTDLRVTGAAQGVLDWYTVLVGVFALAALCGHGALFLAWRCSGPVQARATRISLRAYAVTAALGAGAVAATAIVRPHFYGQMLARPLSYPLVLLAAGSLLAVFVLRKRGKELGAFLASAGFLLGTLSATAVGAFPDLLVSTVAPEHTITAYSAATGAYGLRVGLTWWCLAMPLALGYFAYLYRSLRGKVVVS